LSVVLVNCLRVSYPLLLLVFLLDSSSTPPVI
jgi:hypothetical protein